MASAQDKTMVQVLVSTRRKIQWLQKHLKSERRQFVSLPVTVEWAVEQAYQVMRQRLRERRDGK